MAAVPDMPPDWPELLEGEGGAALLAVGAAADAGADCGAGVRGGGSVTASLCDGAGGKATGADGIVCGWLSCAAGGGGLFARAVPGAVGGV